MICGLILWAVLLIPASAAETLEQLLEGLKITRVSEFRYTEAREMKLLNQARLAQGRMVVSPQRMAIEQITPKQTLVLIAADRLQYLEPARDIYFVKRLKGSLAASGMASFLGLLQARMSLEQLQAQFQLEVEQDGKTWKMILIPRQQKDIGRMEVSGLTGRGADLLKLVYVDGDLTSWALTLVAEGPVAEQNLDALLKRVEILIRSEPSAER